MRKYLSVSKQITMEQINELFEGNTNLEGYISINEETLRRNECFVQLTKDRGVGVEPTLTFDTDVDKDDEDLKYIINLLEFYFGTKIWEYDDLKEMYRLFGSELL